MNNYPDSIHESDNDPRSPFYKEPPRDIDAELLRVMDPDREGYEVLEMVADCDAFQLTLKELLGQNAHTSLEALGVYARALIMEAEDYIRAELEEQADD